MKQTIKTLAFGVSALAIGLATQAHATQGTSQFVENVDLTITGYAPQITIKNASADKHINKLNLQVQENSINFTFNGKIDCTSNASMNELTSKIYFGPVSIDRDGKSISSIGTLYKKDSITLGEVGEVIEAGDENFTIPLNQINNGHPVLRVDPLAELEKLRQAFNGTDIEFYQQDHDIVLQRPLSVTGTCLKKTNAMKQSSGYETQTGTIQIKYKGDPALNDKPVLNAQLGGNLPNQVQQNPNLPFQLNDIQFQANIPHHYGQCIPAQNPKIRMNFSIAGGKQGLIDLRVKAVSNQYASYGNYYETSGIVKNPENGGNYLDISFPLKEMLSQDKYSYMAIANNKVWNHNMQIEARFKNFDGSNEWSQWQTYDSAIFKHRCEPQVNVPSPAGIGGYNNDQGGSPSLDKVVPAPTMPKIDKIQAPVVPKPTPVVPTPSDIQVKPVAPKPTVPSASTIKAPIEDTQPERQLRAQ